MDIEMTSYTSQDSQPMVHGQDKNVSFFLQKSFMLFFLISSRLFFIFNNFPHFGPSGERMAYSEGPGGYALHQTTFILHSFEVILMNEWMQRSRKCILVYIDVEIPFCAI